MSQFVGALPKPKHFPTPMLRYGKNPYGESLFRIVWAPSVKTLVGGEFADGFMGYRACPAYRHIGQKWIMEKWVSPFEYTRMDEETYNLEFRGTNGYCITGPYPSRGAYFHCHTFEVVQPGDCNIEFIAGLIKKAKHNDPNKNRQSILDAQQAQEKADDKMRWDAAKDSLPAFGFRAASFRGGVKSQKSKAMPWKTANELGLPTRGVTNLAVPEQ